MPLIPGMALTISIKAHSGSLAARCPDPSRAVYIGHPDYEYIRHNRGTWKQDDGRKIFDWRSENPGTVAWDARATLFDCWNRRELFSTTRIHPRNADGALFPSHALISSSFYPGPLGTEALYRSRRNSPFPVLTCGSRALRG